MKIIRLVAACLIITAVTTVAYIAKEDAPAGSKMADAAVAFLGTLNAEQKAKATFDFSNKERFNWIFVPMQDEQRRPTRKGLRFEEMSDEQKKAVLAMLKCGLSETGYSQAVTIMSLESILNDLEKNGRMVRNPGWYFVSVFGTPAKTGDWGWRIEGHHLSLNFTVRNGQMTSATPAFFGANPAEMMAGPKKGQRILPEIEDVARKLIKSLTPEQVAAAKQAKHFGEPTDKTVSEKVGTPVGVSAAKLTDSQRDLLQLLIKAYTDRMEPGVAAAQQRAVAKTKPEDLYFGYTGSPNRGEGYTYRIQAPTFIVQFLNVQADSAKNPANHIHSAWRELPKDFGE